MTRHLISVTLTPAAYEVTRLWAQRRAVSATISAAIIHWDENGPRSQKFREQQSAVIERERSIAFLGRLVREQNERIDVLLKRMEENEAEAED